MDQMQFGEIGEAPWRIVRWRPSGPLFIHPRIHPPRHAGENFRCKKTIQVDGLTLPGSIADPDPQEKVISLSLSGFIGMLLQQFSYVCCMRWRRVARLLRRLNLRINFPKFFPPRVFAGNLGVEPSERFHICSNIGNPPASLLFSNGFHISGVSHWKFKKSFLDKIWYCEFVMGASKERWLPPSSQPKLDYIWIP